MRPARHVIPAFGVVLAAVVVGSALPAYATTARAVAATAGFTAGGVVVYRVGDGTAALSSSANPVFLDEYATSGGSPTATTALPTAASGASAALVASGSATSEGLLTRSTDGRYLIATGYNAAPGTASISGTSASADPRVVARIGADGSIDTTTALTNAYSANNVRGATSTDGSQFWLGGAGTLGGVLTAPLGATSATQLSTDATNVRSVQIYGGQLYVTSASGTLRVGTVGTGTPTSSGQSITNLPGISSSNVSSPYELFFASSTVLYVADTSSIDKFVLTGGTWTAAGTITGVSGISGLTGQSSGGSVSLWATDPGGLYSFTDSSGSGTVSGAATQIATAGTNEVFRGVALAPAASTTVTPADLTVAASGPSAAVSGTSITYTLTVGNSGGTAVPATTVTATVPSGSTFDSASNGGTDSGSTVTWTGVAVPASSSTTLTFTVDTPASSTETVTLPAGAVTVDPDQSVPESSYGNNTTTTAVTTSVSPQVQIHDIQGAAQVSPYAGKSVASVPGIVTSVTSSSFVLEAPQSAWDSNPATSEGMEVYGSSAAGQVAVGDAVTVSGTVSEYRSASYPDDLSTTEITSPSVQVVSTGDALPPTVVIGFRTGEYAPPTQYIEDPADDPSGKVDTESTFDPTHNGVDYYESLEAMRVEVDAALVVGPTYAGKDVYVAAEGGAGIAQPSARGGALVVPPNGSTPADFNPEIVSVYAPAGAPDARVGDTFDGPIVGIIDEAQGTPELTASAALPAVTQGSLPEEETPLSGGNGQLSFATFNVENLSPNDPAAKFTGLGQAVVTNLNSPDIISVEEIQDDDGTTDDGVVAADKTISMLTGAISAAGGPTYSSTEIDPVNDADGGQPGGNIRQVLLYRTDRGLSFSGQQVGSSTAAESVTTDASGQPQLSLNPGRIDPSNSAWNASRKPLAAEFQYDGRNVFVISNHLIAKLGDDNLLGEDQPPAQSSETQRLAQTTEINTFVQQIYHDDANAAVIVAGDMNDLQFSSSIDELDQTPLDDLITTLPVDQQYTYDYEGNSEVLDHILASPAIAPQAQIDVVHINSEYPGDEALSDHDPVVATFDLNAAPQAADDAYTVGENGTLSEDASDGVFANDTGGPLGVVSSTTPQHGSLSLDDDGSFRYTPTPGFTGTDTFSYTASNAVQVYSDDVPPLGTYGGTTVTGGGYGSSLYPKPGTTDEFYGLEDRGPNVTGPDGNQVEPIPDFDPAIGLFTLEAGGVAHLDQSIPLLASDGSPMSGRVNSANPTGETIEDLDGNALPQDPNGIDSEGLVAMPDGTFYVSDEYGPFVYHFDATGRELSRFSPLGDSPTLPAELANRIPNRGMEGLTVTPDGTELVGIMQSALQQPDLDGSSAKKLTPLRIVTIDLASGAEHEYLYLLDDPAANGTAVSEITALSDTQFLVDERDGNYATPTAPSYKKLFEIDLTGATDVGPGSPLIGTGSGSGAIAYDSSSTHEGLTIGGASIEKLLLGQNTARSAATLAGDGITVVNKTLDLDVDAVLARVDPDRTLFSHDKFEGVSVLDGGAELVISNDSDFGISAATGTGPGGTQAPYQLVAKTSPTTGAQDDGQLLVIHTDELPAQTTTATVTITVTPRAATSLTLSQSSGTSTYGSGGAVTATLSFASNPHKATSPTGTIAFSVNGTVVDTVKAAARTTLPALDLPAGADTVTATYSGDGTYVASTSPSLSRQVSAAATKTAEKVTVHGSTVTVAVTVTAPKAGTPTGDVTITIDGTAVATVTLGSNGKATYTSTTLTAGTHQVQVTYAGDADRASSASASKSVKIR